MTQVASTPIQVSPLPAPSVTSDVVAAAKPSPLSKFKNVAEWWNALGRVPLERVLTNPWPASEPDLVLLAERDKHLCELIGCTLVEKAMGQYESMIASALSAALIAFVRPRKLGFVSGEAGMNRMISGNIRMPDVTFVSIEDLPNREFPKTAVPSLKPTIAVEVLSASNTATEIRLKLQDYFESGSRLAWVIDPSTQTIAIYSPNSEARPVRVLVSTDVLDGGAVLPGFQINVAELFVTTL